MAGLDTTLSPALQELRTQFIARVVGQEAAIDNIVQAIARYHAGLAGRERPVGAFLLLGPTGVGKTLTVETLADLLQGSPRAVLKVHCAELRSDHELARMKGSPPGYVGWKECVPLFAETRLQEVRLRNDLALVLFDEVEKAHFALWDLLLGLLDKGEVVLNNNTRSDFRKTLIFLTGNAGAREVDEALAGGIGFAGAHGNIAGITTRAAARLFSPEFRNRLAATISYRPLSWDDILKVCRLELDRLTEHVIAAHSITLQYTQDALEYVTRQGFEPKFGARGIKRVIEQFVEVPLANILTKQLVQPRDHILVDVEDDAIRFQRQP